MGTVSVVESLSLDGVMQAPGRPDEDRRGGFELGGWAIPYSDEVMAREMGKGMGGAGALLFGRRTYQDLYGAWADRVDPNPYTAVLNSTHKYVVSRTLVEPLPWMNSTLLAGDAVGAVGALKARPGEVFTVLGSGELVRTLLRHSLVDHLTLLIHPLVLGSGRRLFEEQNTPTALRLVGTVATTTGVVIASYERA